MSNYWYQFYFIARLYGQIHQIQLRLGPALDPAKGAYDVPQTLSDGEIDT